MEKVVLCGWVCSECVDLYGWEEDRELPVGHIQSCENCSKEFEG